MIAWLGTLGLLASWLTSQEQVAAVPLEKQPGFQEALGLWETGARDDSLARFRRLCESQSSNQRAFLEVAYFLADQGAFEAALPFAKVACERTAPDPRAFGLLGLCCMQTKRKKEAEVAFRQGTERFPRNAELQFNLGMASKVLGKILEAQEGFDAALALNPESSLYAFNSGVNWLVRSRYEEAEVLLRRAAAGAPPHPDACWRLGQVLGFLGRGEAEAWFLQAFQHSQPPRSRETRKRARYYYSVYLFEERRYGDAEPSFSELVREYPNHRMGWMYLGRCQKALGKLDEARESMARFRSIQVQKDHADDAWRQRFFEDRAKKKRSDRDH